DPARAGPRARPPARAARRCRRKCETRDPSRTDLKTDEGPGRRRFPLDAPSRAVTVDFVWDDPVSCMLGTPIKRFTMLLLRAVPLLLIAGAGAAGLWYGPLTDEIWRILLGAALGFATLSSLCMLLFGQEEVTAWRVYLAFFFLLPAALVI